MTSKRCSMYDNAVARYSELYGSSSDVRIIRAPGRVNVIGEHTDYNGLPVLPTAIDREIAIAFTATDSSEVCLANVDTRFTQRRFVISSEIEPYPAGDWGNYAKAAAQALWNWTAEDQPALLPLKGFRGCATGSIPPGSGLSSSSAMVVAVACVIVEVNELPIGKQELAELLARAERYVGTEGGGMDQAASLLSQEGALLKIGFAPLRVQPVPMPDGYVLVIANSMTCANKAGGARLAFNTRVVECRLGVQMLKALAKEKYPEISNAKLLGDISALVPEWKQLLGALPCGPQSLEQIADFCKNDIEQVRECLRMRDGSLLGAPAEGFQVKRRSRHALCEGERVLMAVSALQEGSINRLGELMDLSHLSCAQDYEISCPELEKLVAALHRHGAIGARLTGAGFGGCAVALVNKHDAVHLLEGVWRDYYKSYLSNNSATLSDSDRDKVLFVCSASAGAGTIATQS